jgi:hypothetical protein
MRDTIDMAREAGFVEYELEDYSPSGHDIRYERFEALVRADEREACADVVESTPWSDWFRTDCAAAIRNRGNT